MALLGNNSYLFISDSNQSLVTKIALGNSDGSATELYATDYTYQLKQVGAMRKSGFNYPVEIRDGKTNLIAYQDSGSNKPLVYRGKNVTWQYSGGVFHANNIGSVGVSVTSSAANFFIGDKTISVAGSTGAFAINDKNEIFSLQDNVLYQKYPLNKKYDFSVQPGFTYLSANENWVYSYNQKIKNIKRTSIFSGSTESVDIPGDFGNYAKIQLSPTDDIYIFDGRKLYIYKGNQVSLIFTTNNDIRQLTFDGDYIHVITTANEIYDTIKIYKK